MAIGKLYIKINNNDRETHWKTAYHEIGMSGAPKGPLKGTLGPRKGLWRACKLFICTFLRIIGMLYIKIDLNYRETHWNTYYHDIGMSEAPARPLKWGLMMPQGPLGGP